MFNNSTLINATANNDTVTDFETAKSVYSYARFFASYINNAYDNYNVVVDCDEINARACKDDYIHVYRHNTSNVANRAHNNVFQCYLKHKKQCINILCNKTNFNAFSCDIEHIKQYKNSSLIRYIVSYDNFISFMSEIIAYDNARQITSATKENALQIAK